MSDPNVEPTIAHLVTPLRKFFDRADPLDQIPHEWLAIIEGKVARWKDRVSKGDCWFWLGQTDWAGEPKITKSLNKSAGNQRGTRRLKYWVMELFYDFSRVKQVNIVHLCGHDNCINPRHMRICGSQHFQRNPEKDFAECESASNEALTRDCSKLFTGEAIW